MKYEVVIVILLALIFVKMFFPQIISKYAPLNINGTGVEPGEFFNLKNSLNCVAGPSKTATFIPEVTIQAVYVADSSL